MWGWICKYLYFFAGRTCTGLRQEMKELKNHEVNSQTGASFCENLAIFSST